MSIVEKEDVEYLYNRLDTRWNSKQVIKKSIHRTKIEKLLNFLEPGKTLLDVCRGGSVDGILGVMAAKKGLKVTICSSKQEYLDVIKRFADVNAVKIDRYVICSPDTLLFEDNSFDYVSCIHVLEHVYRYEEAIKEIYRVTNKHILVAMPTCLNLCVFARIGGADYYKFKWNSIFCLLLGGFKVLLALLTFQKGVFEKNEEKGIIIKHLQRFPWIIRREFEKNGFKIIQYGADGFCFPWWKYMIRWQKKLDKLAYAPFVRNLGFGTHIFAEKRGD